MVSNLVVQLIG
jgi:Mrp family chromosome partitioning ATPase